MKKLLGLVIMLSAALVLSIGTTGCTTKKEKDKDAAKTKDGKDAKDAKDAKTKDAKEKDAKGKDEKEKGKDKEKEKASAPRLLNEFAAQLQARNEPFVANRVESTLGRRYQTISR